jgi:hypothetical protein
MVWSEGQLGKERMGAQLDLASRKKMDMEGVWEERWIEGWMVSGHV